ncbi:hypothetical protein ACFLRU_06710 [Bacteroidota bacterium]
MKNTMKRVLVMSILLAGLLVNAKNTDPNPAVEIKSLNSERFMLLVDDLQSNTLIQIKDDFGVVLYSEKLKSGKDYKKAYDISSFPEGVYYVKLVNTKYSKVYSVKKEAESLDVKIDFFFS